MVTVRAVEWDDHGGSVGGTVDDGRKDAHTFGSQAIGALDGGGLLGDFQFVFGHVVLRGWLVSGEL